MRSNVSTITDQTVPQTRTPRENIEAYTPLEKDLEREQKYDYGYGNADFDAAEARDMLRARLDACRRPWW